MPEPDPKSEHEKISLHLIISLVLSIYILGSLLIQTWIKLTPGTAELLNKIDFIVCFFFLYDFFLRLYQAESKIHFLKWNWIDFVSSIPMLGVFQWTRVVRIVRILRAVRSMKVLIQFLFRNKSRGTVGSAIIVALLMMIFSTIAMLNVETAPDSNIKTPEDAVWWAFTTITTVGYGDKYPVTTEGRVVAAMLMISSVGLFGIFTGFIASFFVAEDKKQDDTEHLQTILEEIRLLRLKVEELSTSAQNSGRASTAQERELMPKIENS